MLAQHGLGGPAALKAGFVLVGAPRLTGTWPRRFAVLTAGCVRFFSDAGDALPLSELDLDARRSGMRVSYARPSCLTVSGEGAEGWQELLLVAESDAERDDWLAKLSLAADSTGADFAERAATYGVPGGQQFPGRSTSLRAYAAAGEPPAAAGAAAAAASSDGRLPPGVPPRLKGVVAAPHRVLGVSARPSLDSLCDAFRAACLAHDESLGGEDARGEFERCALAFQLLQAQVAEGEPLRVDLGVRPNALVSSLVPLPGGSPVYASMRACRLLRLRIPFVEHAYKASEGGWPFAEYEIHSSYAMRSYVVRRRYREWAALHETVAPRLASVGADVPELPARSWLFVIGYRDVKTRARDLANYLRALVAAMQATGHFSPDLMRFLGIDAPRVHADEEGRMALQLDRHAGADEGWFVVDEQWLKAWRLFVTGLQRMPPGPVTNGRLLSGSEVRPGLQPVRDYRCISGGMWALFEQVYGGGPALHREAPDIYSPAVVA